MKFKGLLFMLAITTFGLCNQAQPAKKQQGKKQQGQVQVKQHGNGRWTLTLSSGTVKQWTITLIDHEPGHIGPGRRPSDPGPRFTPPPTFIEEPPFSTHPPAQTPPIDFELDPTSNGG